MKVYGIAKSEFFSLRKKPPISLKFEYRVHGELHMEPAHMQCLQLPELCQFSLCLRKLQCGILTASDVLTLTSLLCQTFFDNNALNDWQLLETFFFGCESRLSRCFMKHFECFFEIVKLHIMVMKLREFLSATVNDTNNCYVNYLVCFELVQDRSSNLHQASVCLLNNK